MSSRRRVSSLFARGEPMVWLTGAALVVCLLMIAGLLTIVIYNGASTFWPKPLTQLTTHHGKTYLGEESQNEDYNPATAAVADWVPAKKRPAPEASVRRRMYRTGNYEVFNTHFTWLSDYEIAEEFEPRWGIVVERQEWGRFYGKPHAFHVDGKPVANEPAAVWARFEELHESVRARREAAGELNDNDLNDHENDARLERTSARLKDGADSDEWREADKVLQSVRKRAEEERIAIRRKTQAMQAENDRYELIVMMADGETKALKLADIVRAYLPNQLSLGEKWGVYLSRWGEFLSDNPREANSEGGVFPAIFGTIIMTLIMSILVVPFGVLAALYLREYAKQGTLVSIVRIAVNNLAGVPSIVFGVFGLGFFCYFVGVGIDDLLFPARVAENTPTFGKGGILWASLTLALLTLPVVIMATEEAISAVPHSMREGSYACGASKWQTIRKIVLPRAAPGIMTGMILAIARGAGEVAPLMLVGAVKLAPDLPMDGSFPFVHPERSFMHLGFHIYDLGFQSPNSKAAEPMVFTTTMLLIGIVVLLNLVALWVRARLRRQFEAG